MVIDDISRPPPGDPAQPALVADATGTAAGPPQGARFPLISFWLGTAFRFALIGMCFGAILGLLGLAMTRWESQPQGFFYTPSRWLALLVTLVLSLIFFATNAPRMLRGLEALLLLIPVLRLLPRLIHPAARPVGPPPSATKSSTMPPPAATPLPISTMA